MFDRRWRKVLGDLWLHRWRSLLVVAAVAIGLTGSGIVLNAWALVQRATDLGYRASLPVSATLAVSGLDGIDLGPLRAHPDIAAVRLRRALPALVRADGAWRKALIYAFDDFESAAIGRLTREVGSWPPAAGAIVIEHSSLDYAGATVGAGLAVRVGEQPPQSLKVDGIARDVSLAPGWMEHLVYAYASTDTLAQLGAPTGFDELQIRVRDDGADRAAVRRVAAAAKTWLEAAGARVGAIDVPEPGEHIHAAQMDSLLLTQGVFGLLSLLVCAFLVVNLISAMLAGQAREIGVMKTLGASPGQIGRMYLALALILGALASLIALPAALVAGRAYAGVKAEMLNFPIDGHAVPWWAIALQLAVGCLLPVMAAALPVRRAVRMSVGAALRDIGIVAPASGLQLRRVIAVGGLSRPLLLAIGNAFRRRQRMALTVSALALGGAVFLGAQSLRLAVRGSVDQIFDTQHFDLALRLDRPQAAASLQAAALAVAGVERAEAWRGARAVLGSGDEGLPDSISLTGVPANTAMLAPIIDAGRWLQVDDDQALVVSRRLLKQQPSLRLGSTVALTIAGQTEPWRVVGVVDAGPQSLAYVPRATLDRRFGNGDAGSLMVALAATGQALQLDTTLRLRAALDAAGMTVAGSQLLAENRRVLDDHLLMVVDFLGAMGWLMLVVGGMGLASTMSLGVLERTREIGVLRAIGAGHGAIMTLIQVEALVVATLSWLIAIPLSVPMSLSLGAAFGRIMFSVPPVYLPGATAVFVWLGLMLLIAVVACAWPALRAIRVPTARALSYE